MRSSAIPEAVVAAANQLAPAPLRAVEEVRKGGNSRIFRVVTADGPFALKAYPGDTRDRQGAEARALEYFARAGIGHTPRLVTLDRATRMSLLSWIDGVAVDGVNDADVEAFARFQLGLHDSADERAHAEISEASEACLSGSRIVSHIQNRLDRLRAVKDQVPDFGDFLEGTLVRSLEAFEVVARRRYAELGIDFDRDLPIEQRTLIASDFGAHNALRRSDGSLAFVDFEYFGWDDPATSIGNFIYHPGMVLSAPQRELYSALVAQRFGAKLESRRGVLMPLFALRWATIILGELLPDRWRHRLAAGGASSDDWEAACRRQIGKARQLLNQVTSRPD